MGGGSSLNETRDPGKGDDGHYAMNGKEDSSERRMKDRVEQWLDHVGSPGRTGLGGEQVRTWS